MIIKMIRYVVIAVQDIVGTVQTKLSPRCPKCRSSNISGDCSYAIYKEQYQN